MTANISRIEKSLTKANIVYIKVENKNGWITVHVRPNEPSSISSKVCEALNPEFGYQIITSWK